MNTYYDVLQLLKKYEIYIHVGKRLWDIELAALEIDNMHKSGLINDKDYARVKIILLHEHSIEEKQPTD